MLRRLILQSLLFAVENESAGGFELLLGAVSQTTVMFPITDFLIELTSAVDELQRLRGLLGPHGSVLCIDSDRDLASTYRALVVPIGAGARSRRRREDPDGRRRRRTVLADRDPAHPL